MATIASPLTVTPVHPAFAALISGVDLTQPLDDATFERIAVAFDDHSVLVFRGQALSDAQQMAFSERWGPLETTVRTLGGEDRLGAHIVDLSNTDADGKLMGWDDRRMQYQSGNQLWHSDSSFKPVPAHSSALSARVVPPEGGETEFASMRVAYETLDENVRRDVDRQDSRAQLRLLAQPDRSGHRHRDRPRLPAGASRPGARQPAQRPPVALHRLARLVHRRAWGSTRAASSSPSCSSTRCGPTASTGTAGRWATS